MQCGDDKTIKCWNMEKILAGEDDAVNTILGKVNAYYAKLHNIDLAF